MVGMVKGSNCEQMENPWIQAFYRGPARAGPGGFCDKNTTLLFGSGFLLISLHFDMF